MTLLLLSASAFTFFPAMIIFEIYQILLVMTIGRDLKDDIILQPLKLTIDYERDHKKRNQL